MKSFLLFISFVFILVFIGCASTKNSSNKTKIQIIEASYHTWSEKLPNSSIPENGIDLRIILENWPKKYEAGYIVFRNYKSSPATIADSSGGNIEIHARIIRTSGVLAETSPKSGYSHRLVFTTAKGDTAFLEIEEWQQVEE